MPEFTQRNPHLSLHRYRRQHILMGNDARGDGPCDHAAPYHSREVIEANGGVVFKIIGDAFQAAFQLASQGLNTAIDIQRRLATAEWPEACGPLKVRIGLHVGPAALDDRGDYTASHTLNRVGRVMSAGMVGRFCFHKKPGPDGAQSARGGDLEGYGRAPPERVEHSRASLPGGRAGLVTDFPPWLLLSSTRKLPLDHQALYPPAAAGARAAPALD